MLLLGISQAEPKSLASVFKPKTCRALGIAVDFVGDHLKHKKVTEFITLDTLLSEDLGLPILFPTIQVGDHLKHKKVTEFITLDNFYLKIWDFQSRFQQSKLLLQSLCEVCVKNWECH